ncbi:glycosyltransferase family 4 protein [Candidatus Dojkabacteria bacterium]|uniref:Glycosyltransferase family 4 protein n=1 Tax=Candidatus Dojkabacteria bacterium TaxID=2099670 RepID=A0A955L0J5_9BACT|nr:glycosyltransferase family 4 protein [Candidatus Dojkabacteria bacterium]
MKIIQIATFFHPVTGGVETHVLNLSRELEKNGHEVEVLCSDSTKVGKRITKSDTNYFGVEIHRFRSWFSLSYYHKFFPGILRYLWKENYDLTHVHGLRKTESYLAWFVARLRKKPLVLTTHNPFPTSTRSPLAEKLINFHDKLIGKILIKNFSKIISIVPSEKSKLVNEFKIPEQKIVEIPNGVEDVFFSTGFAPNFYREWNINPEKWQGIAVVVGRVSYAKGIQNLKIAIKKLKNVLFFVAGGDDGYLNTLKSSFSGMDNIIFSEKFITPEKQIDMYAAADVLLLPSLHEAFGIVVLEALAQGVPVISTNKGGPAEIFTTRAVKLIDPEDKEEWKVSIEAIVKNTSRAEELGKIGQEFAQKYKWDKVTSKIIDVYEEVLPKSSDSE